MIFTKLVKKYKVLDRLIIRIFSIVIILIRYLVKKEEMPSGKIVIIAMQRLGDAVFSLDAINSIVHFHKQNIVIICNPSSGDIFRYVFPQIGRAHV